jgi:UDP-N-acetylmuramate--alanine ligase
MLPPGGTLIACAEDPGACAVMEEAEKAGKIVLAYGLRPAPAADRVTDVYTEVLSPNEQGGFTFSASILGQPASVALQLPGKHNVRNALAALTVSELLSLPLEQAAEALGRFHGTGRRFEVRGEANGVTVIDDYAHHPTEISATLSAARARYPGRRIWAAWQPHTYSRTRALFDGFAQAFADADEVIVTEIFAAREPHEDYSAADVVQGMPGSARFIPELKDVSNHLLSNLRPGDVLLVLSAGDADAISTEVLARLKEVQNG